ncbi:MAG: ATP-binding protein [Smithella sp.]
MATPIPRKKTIFLVRLMVIVTTAYFILLSPAIGKDLKNYGYIFIAAYLLTNLFVAYIPEKYFNDDKVFYGFILCDSILLPAGIYFSGYIGSDLYLMFFFIISLTTMSSSFGYLMVNTLLFAVIYSWLLNERGVLTGPMAGSYLIQIPFIIVIAFFYGYLITSRLKDKDKRIREARERYEQIVQATDVLMCIVDQDGKLLFTNKKFAEFHGYQDQRSLSDLDITQVYNENETKAEQSLNYVKSVYQSNSMVQYESYDGNHNIWFANTLNPIRDPSSGDILAVCIISKDITERVEREKKLNTTVELLIKTRDQLIQQDKMAALGRMASGIAHEIRNPLEIIYMGVDYLESNISNNDPEIGASIEKIFNAVTRADTIIKNILAFSRKSECEITQIPICQLLDNTLLLAQQTIQKNRVTVKCEYDDKLLEVSGDYNLLEHVFLNIFNNAVDAMKNCNDKILKVVAYKKVVNEIGYKTGYRHTDFFKIGENMIVVEVSDTGKGMPKDVQSKIFEPFFTTKPLNEGTGLGLSIAHMMMARLNGTIDVASKENQGTTFFINLQPTCKLMDIQEVEDDR